MDVVDGGGVGRVQGRKEWEGWNWVSAVGVKVVEGGQTGGRVRRACLL